MAANEIIRNTLKFVTDSVTTLSITTLCDLIYRCLAKSKYYEKGVKDEIPSDLKKAYLKPPEGGDTSNVAWARMPVRCSLSTPTNRCYLIETHHILHKQSKNKQHLESQKINNLLRNSYLVNTQRGSLLILITSDP